MVDNPQRLLDVVFQACSILEGTKNYYMEGGEKKARLFVYVVVAHLLNAFSKHCKVQVVEYVMDRLKTYLKCSTTYFLFYYHQFVVKLF